MSRWLPRYKQFLIGALLEYSVSGEFLVRGQVIQANHRGLWLKPFGNPKLLFLEDWPSLQHLGHLRSLPVQGPLFEKTIVFRGEFRRRVSAWKRWWDRLRGVKWERAPSPSPLDFGEFLPQRRTLVKGIVCADGIFLPNRPRGHIAKFYYFSRYNHLKNHFPQLWKQWITRERRP